MQTVVLLVHLFTKAAYVHCKAHLQMWLNQTQPQPAL